MAKDKIEIEVIAKGLDAVKQDMEALQKSMKKTGQQSQENAGLFQKSWVKAAAVVTVALVGIKKALDFGKAGAKIQQSMDATAKQFGVSVDSMLKKLKQATGETVSNTDLISAANRTMALNVTTDMDKMSELFGVARARAKAMGIDTSQAVNDIATGIGRASPLILDNLGIITKGWAEEAKAAGKAFDSQFILNKVLEDGASIVEKSNHKVLTMAERYEKMGASAQNAVDTIKRAFGAELLELFEDLGTEGENAFDKINDSMVEVRRTIRVILGSLLLVKELILVIFNTVRLLISPITALLASIAEFSISLNTIGDARSMIEKLGAAFKTLGEVTTEEASKALDGYKNNFEETSKVIEKFFAKIDALVVKSTKTQKDANKDSVQDATKAAQEAASFKKQMAQKAIQAAQATADAIFTINQQAREAELEAELAFIEQKFENANEFTERLKALDQEDLEAKKENINQEIAEANRKGNLDVVAEKKRQLQRIDLEEKEAKRAIEIEDQKEKEMAAVKRRAWEKQKAADLARVAINAAMAFTQTMAFSTLPSVSARIALASAAAAITGAQAIPIAAQSPPQFADGTPFAPGGQAIVGERGPELVNLPAGSEVIPNERVTENISNSNVSITVNANDPITFVNELRQTYGLDVFQEA